MNLENKKYLSLKIIKIWGKNKKYVKEKRLQLLSNFLSEHESFHEDPHLKIEAYISLENKEDIQINIWEK